MPLLRKVKNLNLQSTLHLVPQYPLSASAASNNLRTVHTVGHICGEKLHVYVDPSNPNPCSSNLNSISVRNPSVSVMRFSSSSALESGYN